MVPDWGQNTVVHRINFLTLISKALWFFVRVEHLHRFDAVIKHDPVAENRRRLVTRSESLIARLHKVGRFSVDVTIARRLDLSTGHLYLLLDQLIVLACSVHIHTSYSFVLFFSFRRRCRSVSHRLQIIGIAYDRRRHSLSIFATKLARREGFLISGSLVH